MPLPLPPGIDRATFNRAMADCHKVVGDDWVFTSEEDVLLYRDAYSPERDEPTERLTSAAVAPNTVEQVQRIVRIANEHKIASAHAHRNDVGQGNLTSLVDKQIVESFIQFFTREQPSGSGDQVSMSCDLLITSDIFNQGTIKKRLGLIGGAFFLAVELYALITCN